MKTQLRFPTRMLATLAILVALEVILTRFLSIQTPFLRIGFGFLPIAMAGYLFGILPAGLMAVTADLLGMLLFPAGTFFPGFTLSAFLTGGLYGFFLHGRKPEWVRIALVSLIIAVVIDLTLNTIWLSILNQKAALALLPARLVKSALLLPIQVLLIRGMIEGVRRSGIPVLPVVAAR